MIDLDALVIGPTVQTFGTSVTYTPMISTSDGSGRPALDANGNPILTAGTPYAAVGVFDEAFTELTPGGEGHFPSTEAEEFGSAGGITEGRPVLGVQLSAMLSQPAQGDQIAINGANYVVKEVQPDGHGHALLVLNLA